MKKLTITQKTVLLLMFLAALCLCALIAALIPTAPQHSPASPPTNRAPTSAPAPTATDGPPPLQHRAAGAIVQCRHFIKDQLVSPSSATFSNEEAYGVNGERDNYHAVTGVVESQNRMGVWLRTEYRCDVHYLPDDYLAWVLDYLKIDD